MSTHIKTQEVIDAAVALLSAAGLAFGPKLIQDGELGWYVENDALSLDLPALLVTCGGLELDVTGEDGLSVMGGQEVAVHHVLRVLVVFQWTDTEDLNRVKRSIAQEVVEVFIGSAGSAFGLGAAIAGIEAFQVFPTGVEFDPPEDTLVSKDRTRQVAAVAITAAAQYRAVR